MSRIFVLLLACLFLTTPAFATTYIVDAGGGGHATLISQGLALVSDGDSLVIKPGLYHETSLQVNRSIVIKGWSARWPIVDGNGAGTIFRVAWGKKVTFKNLVLRNAQNGIWSRLDGNACGTPSQPWTVDSLVVYNMTGAGLAADNENCAVGSTTWSNVLAMNCQYAYLANDYGSVTASRMVAMNCAYGTHTWNGAANFSCCIFWNNTHDYGGLTPITIPGLIHADPLIHFYPNDTDPQASICVHPTLSPCLPANNACNKVIGVLSTGPCPAPTAVPSEPPLASRLGQSTPNPFTFTMTIAFEVAGAGENVTLRVYDVSGRLVRTLVDRHVAAGPASAEWDGRDNHGRQVSSGLYFYRLTTPTMSEVKKTILLR